MSADDVDPAFLGSNGLEWMHKRGWTVVAFARPFRLYANEIRIPRCTIRRAYFAPVRGSHSTPAPVDADERRRATITHLVSGSMQVQSPDGAMHDAGLGATFIRRDDEALTLECSEPVALIQIEVDERVLDAIPAGAGDRIEERGAAGAIFRGLVMSLFAVGIDGTDAATLPATRALVALMNGLLDADPIVDRISEVTPSEAAVLERARGYILAHAADPHFTVTDILEGINVSRSYLFRVFSRVESTPLRYLAEVRLARARQEMATVDPRRVDAVRAIAERNGFASLRALRSALARAS